MEIVYNDCYYEARDNRSRFLILYGGSGSGKSFFAAQKVVRRILSETPHRILVLRKVKDTIKNSVFREIKDVLSEWEVYNQFDINKTEKTFVHKENGNEILCLGLDDEQKIKSIKGITSMWIEEATEFSQADFIQLNLRIRGVKENYVQYILSFNPIDENHWLKYYFFDNKREGSLVVHTTYKDNYFLAEEEKDVLESLKEDNPLYYQVYCLGEWGVVDTSNKFLYAFSKETHVEKCKANDSTTIRLSFDFNIDPFAVLVYQRIGDTVNVIDHIRLPNSDIEQVCDAILGRYGEQKFIVTGDASGKGRTGVVRGKRSYWEVILNRLNIRKSETARVRVRSKNLDLLESRVLCNLVLQNEKITIRIDPKNEHLINDCLYANVDDRGILVKDRNKQKNDFLDAFRYLLDAEFPHIVRNPKRYK